MTIEFKINSEDWKLPSSTSYTPEVFAAFEVSNVYGGLPRVRKVEQIPTITISATYEFGSYADCLEWSFFYTDVIKQGALPFKALLDIGAGAEVYDVQISDEGATVNEVDVEYISVTLPLIVTISGLNVTYLSEEFNIMSNLEEDVFLKMKDQLPLPTDPFFLSRLG